MPTEETAVDNGTLTVGEAASAGSSDESSALAAVSVSKHFQKLQRLLHTDSLIIMMVGAISLSWIWPKLGSIYVYPDITSSWLAVIIIFFVSGLGMHTEEFSAALVRPKFNFFVQLFNFLVVSCLVYIFSRLMLLALLLPQSLADGIVICSCLPQAICTVVVLTKSAGGDVASAILNSAFSNLIGIVISPILILCYLGVGSHVDEGEVFLKLSMKVALPLLAGQLVHHLVPGAKEFASRHSNRLGNVQEGSMTFIIFTTFSSLFLNGTGTTLMDIALMGALQCLIMLILMLYAWLSLRLFFPGEVKLHASGLFICISKTMPMGIPLINALYEDDPNLALYTLPLIMWYPFTIVLGAFMAPFVLRYVEREERNSTTSTLESSPMDYHEMGEFVLV